MKAASTLEYESQRLVQLPFKAFTASKVGHTLRWQTPGVLPLGSKTNISHLED